MNSDAQLVIEELVREVGAVVKCGACHGEEVRPGDESAERMAYARATNDWKAGYFGRMEREETLQLVASELDAVPHECRVCSANI